MAYALGLRLLAALFGMTIIGIPVSYFLIKKANEVEAEREAMAEAAQED